MFEKSWSVLSRHHGDWIILLKTLWVLLSSFFSEKDEAKRHEFWSEWREFYYVFWLLFLLLEAPTKMVPKFESIKGEAALIPHWTSSTTQIQPVSPVPSPYDPASLPAPTPTIPHTQTLYCSWMTKLTSPFHTFEPLHMLFPLPRIFPSTWYTWPKINCQFYLSRSFIKVLPRPYMNKMNVK